MTKTDFNKILKVISTNKKLDVKKISYITNTARQDMIYFIVRNRAPIVKDLIPDGFDLKWLACMGYMYETKGKQYTFLHTCEHTIK